MTDLDPMLREAMARMQGPVGVHPSLGDVRRRARRRNHRRMAVTAGVVACTGVATAALVVRHDASTTLSSGSVGSADTSATSATVLPASTVELPAATQSGVNGVDETPTTISGFDGIMLIDGGAPAGAMEDAYQRLNGYNRTIVPGSGKTIGQTVVMPIGDNTELAKGVGSALKVDGLDTWDPSFVGASIEGLVAVVIGPDYFDRVQNDAVAATTASP